jgi:hypothetical protein
MKKINILIIIALLFIMGCQKGILDKSPENFLVEDDVWNDFGLVKQFQTDVYRGLGSGNLTGQTNTYFDDFTDNCRTSESIGNVYSINKGDITSTSMGSFDGLWELNYQHIRKANIFLEKIDNLTVGTDQEKQILKGEVLYLRAAMYFRLIKLFGGVPRITKVYTLSDDFQVGRDSYEDMVDWIVEELDKAMDLVPLTRPSSEWGRITKGICLATKAEVLLQANSKLHNPDTVPNGPLFDYSKNTWQECADAAKAVIDMPQYELQKVQTPEDYHNIFLTPNPEIIFAKVNSVDHGYPGQSNFNGTNGPDVLGGINETMALQDLIDEYQMKNGKFINEAGSGYDPSPENMYKNREIRFDADITYYGKTFKGALYGLAYPDGYLVNSKRVSTGYPVRKYLDASVSMSDPSPLFAWIRLADIYLIYAEAQYELGHEDEARTYINKIRERALLPDITTSGENLFRDLQHERRIELFFEDDKRFMDVRRWMIADVIGSKPDKGIILEKKDANGNLDPNGTLTYRYQIIQTRSFPEKFYYLPIPENEIQRSGIEQNPGY